jgi:hypothetical protein
MKPPVFIVGTGRCGSTMISNVVRLHPRLLSVSELFTALGPRAFTARQLNGERFARLLTMPSRLAGKILAKGGRLEEVLYRFGDGARFGPRDVPPISMTVLPHLSSAPDDLYDELTPELPRGPTAPLRRHIERVLSWLCDRFGRQRAVERSGASLLFVPELARMFPEAKFVHLFRDGRDVALSMLRHPFFRLRVRLATALERLGIDPYRPPFVYGTSRLYVWYEAFSSRFLPVESWFLDAPPLEQAGRYWSRTIVEGERCLDELTTDRTLRVRYEDILAQPREELSRLMRFIEPGAVDSDWLDQASALPRRPASTWRALPIEAVARLAHACAPGLQQLGYPPSLNEASSGPRGT